MVLPDTVAIDVLDDEYEIVKPDVEEAVKVNGATLYVFVGSGLKVIV